MSLASQPLIESNIEPEYIYDALLIMLTAAQMNLPSEHRIDIDETVNEVLSCAKRLSDAKTTNETDDGREKQRMGFGTDVTDILTPPEVPDGTAPIFSQAPTDKEIKFERKQPTPIKPTNHITITLSPTMSEPEKIEYATKQLTEIIGKKWYLTFPEHPGMNYPTQYMWIHGQRLEDYPCSWCGGNVIHFENKQPTTTNEAE